MTNPVTQFSATTQGVAAGGTMVYRGVVQDADGNALGSGVISALTLSITDDQTGAVVNNVSATDILNTGRGALDASGNLTITLLAADTAILRAGDIKENRSLTIDFTYPGGVGRHRVIFTVVAMPGQ